MHASNVDRDGKVPMGAVSVRRKLIVVGIALAVGGLHFITGPGYRGPMPEFVNGYLIDILLPFAMFLVLGVTDLKVIQSQGTRSALVFGVGAITESLQFLGVPIFGRTFDPLDYLMFATGIAGAALFERAAFSRLPGEVRPGGNGSGEPR
jgi:hypothetical protein